MFIYYSDTFPKESVICYHHTEKIRPALLKKVRKLEKLEYKCKKLEIDKDYLETCRRYNVLPKFLYLKVGTDILRNSEAYSQCQHKLLDEEIVIKGNTLESKKIELSSMS